jgi:hypothetical protein
MGSLLGGCARPDARLFDDVAVVAVVEFLDDKAPYAVDLEEHIDV